MNPTETNEISIVPYDILPRAIRLRSFAGPFAHSDRPLQARQCLQTYYCLGCCKAIQISPHKGTRVLLDPGCAVYLQSLCDAGGFIVDDDGAGYMDIGEEDDWGAEAENEDAQDSQPAKKQKVGDSKNGRGFKSHIKIQ